MMNDQKTWGITTCLGNILHSLMHYHKLHILFYIFQFIVLIF